MAHYYSDGALSVYVTECIMALEAAGQSIIDRCKDLRQSNVPVELKQLENLMFSAISTIQRVGNTIRCPINRLPTEILVDVFSLVPQRYLVSKRIAEKNCWPFTLPDVDVHLQLAAVCKHWRNIIIDTPALWSSVSESEGIDPNFPDMWRLVRCPCGPLAIYIKGEVSPRMWSLLKSEGHRIQQLHMAHVSTEGAAMLAFLQALPASQLEHCKIDFSMPENDRQRLVPLFSGDGRRLRSLYLSRVLFLPSNTFPRLTSFILDLSYIHHEDPHWELVDLKNFLAGSPGLENLHLSWLWCRTGPKVSDITPRAVLPHLRNLTLNLRSRFVGVAIPMILSIVELPSGCQIQLAQIPLNELQAMSPSLLALGRPLTRMRLALGASFHDPTGSPTWDWSLVLASHQADCAVIRLVLQSVPTIEVPTLLGAAFRKLPLFADVEEMWYTSQLHEAVLRPVLLPPKVRGLALSIQSWAASSAQAYLGLIARACTQLDTLCICVPNAEHLRDVRKALTSEGPDGRPRSRAIRRVAVGYDRPSTRLSRGAISLRDCGAGTEVSWTGQIAAKSRDAVETEMERLLRAVPQVLEEPASIRESWPTWPDFLSHSY